MHSTAPVKNFIVLLLALGSLAVFAPPAAAAKKYVAPPEIESFTVVPEELYPGAELIFTVEGTPRAQASVRLGGINRTVPLTEISAGVYEGTYTVRTTDRAVANTTIRATLKLRGMSASDSIKVPWRRGPPASAVAPVPAPAPAAQSAPAITSFGVVPIGSIEPGAELKFRMSGTPGGAAGFTIEGVANNVPMREVSSGQYEGSYTVRRMDNFAATVRITGALTANGRTQRVALNQPLVADAKPPVIKNMTPHHGETVAAGGLTSVSATFDDSGGVGVDPKSVRILLGGRDITRNATVSPQFFDFRADLPPGVYPVEVSARDLAGNSVRQSWQFTVAPPAAAATTLPLRVLSHANNAEIGGGSTEIRGRTAPDATVDVEVQGIASLAGLIGITQPILTQSLKADANGNFAFSFQPQIAMPGARYEISLHATKGNLTRDTKLVLFQKK